MHSDELPTADSSDTPKSGDTPESSHPSPPMTNPPGETGTGEGVQPPMHNSSNPATPSDATPDAMAASQAQFLQWSETTLQHLEQRRTALEAEVEQLERRKARIQHEMQTTFAGSSEDIAVRVQSFKEYLLGSLQDLVVAADR
ncbi:DUF3086 domain-containing protein, partial [filamentous cyanobacterium LEGE 11480]|nr:DUF3086 domain-containing protein [Romeriopsis navalis LEGE 11480]